LGVFIGFFKRRYFRAVITLLILSSLMLIRLQIPVSAAGTECQTSGPDSGAYTVTVCITNPTDGAVVSGNTSVTATVNVVGTNPGVQKLEFYLGGQYLLTDYASPYTFAIPTTKFVDGSRLLEVQAILRDSFTSTRAGINLNFNNGITEPPVNTNSFTPTSGTTPQSGRPFILAAVGDGASGEPNADTVTDLIAGWNPNLLLYLGDVYNDGTETEFQNWYGTGSNRYSRFRSITNPTVGNHEYQGLQAPDYFDYWDNVPHYYSFNAAGWHLITLDSTSQYNQTTLGTPQYDWLAQDLAANTAVCTIAYFHHPVYNVGAEGESGRMNQIWALLAEHGVDIVLTGHDHDYQRWYALDGQGQLDPNGMTEFVVGTGGHGIQDFIKTDSRMAVGFNTPPTAFGALRMELNQEGAAFQFVNIQGNVLDSGSIPCSGAATDTTAPHTPTNLTASASGSTHVDLNWTSATDNVGVTNYEIYRDGELIDTIGSTTSYADNTVVGSFSYQYKIRAIDAAGNFSGFSSQVTITAPFLFLDDFESGDLSNWTNITGLSVQSQEVYDGAYAARQTSTSAPTSAYKTLASAQSNIYARVRFKIISLSSITYLLKFRTSTGTPLLSVYVSNANKLGYRNETGGGSNTTSTTSVSNGIWHDLQTHVSINGTSSQVEIWLDGIRIEDLSGTLSLGTALIRRVQLGDNTGGHIYDVAFDNVMVNKTIIDMTPPTVTLSEPSDNAIVREEVTLTATASDNSSLDRVEFFANGILIGTDFTSPYNMIWDSSTASDGPVTLTARAVDFGFNSTTSTASVVTVDNTAPDATIDSGPSGTVNSDSATFTFSSSEPASYICFLDDEEIEDCGSPQTFSNLIDGSHTFQVTATDSAGNNDPTPATRTWIVDMGSATATDTPTNTPTSTPTNTPTSTPTATSTLTATPTPTNTPTSTSTNAPTSVASNTPTSTPTSSPTSTATNTPVSTQNPGGHDLDTTGVFRPSNGLLYLKNSNSSGFADIAINYGLAGDYPVVGDWDGDGDATIGVYRNGNFLLRNANTLGFADLVFAFGTPGDQPIAGDWNGDGVDTIGVYRPSTGQFLLRNSNDAGAPEMSFFLGNVGDVGIAGDWNGDGIDTTGVFRPSNGALYLKNINSTGIADIQINYGLAGDKPVTGDWNNDGVDTIGVYRNGTFYLRNSNTIGVADLVFALGNPGDMPIAGNWDGQP
jgi:Bacterial Ig domain/Calcineurin-like phosphoesterase